MTAISRVCAAVVAMAAAMQSRLIHKGEDMVIRVSELSNLYKFPLGRCVFALRSVEKRAQGVGQRDVALLAGRHAGGAQEAMELVMRFQAGYDSLYPPETTAVDNIVDRCLTGVAGYLDVQIRVYPDEPRGEAAERVLRALFPAGVAAVSRLPFAEEHEQVNTLLERATAEDLAEDVRTLPELVGLLERLDERNREYGELLRQAQLAPTREDVRQAQQRCQDRLAETLSLIIGLYALHSPERTDERDHLLEPIMRQNEALRLLRRRRRVPVDVDPQTGEELPSPASPDDIDESDGIGESAGEGFDALDPDALDPVGGNPAIEPGVSADTSAA